MSQAKYFAEFRRPKVRIGELSQRAGITPKVIRHYDERGLISSRRTAHGHRNYNEDDLERLQIVIKLRQLDFGLEEIRELLPRFRNGQFQGRAEEIQARLEKRLAQVRAKQSALTEVEVWLERLRERMPQHAGRRAHGARRSPEPGSRKTFPIAVIDGCCEPFCGPQTCTPMEEESHKK